MHDGERGPAAVPDDPTLDAPNLDAPDVDAPDRDAAAVDAPWDVDTDGDGHADTLLAADGPDLLVETDLDRDGLADRVLRIGPDGSVRAVHPGPASADSGDGELATGHAPAAPGPWSALFGRLLGLDP